MIYIIAIWAIRGLLRGLGSFWVWCGTCPECLRNKRENFGAEDCPVCGVSSHRSHWRALWAVHIDREFPG